MKSLICMVLTIVMMAASPEAQAYARADWLGSWQGEEGADLSIDDFDGALVFTGVGAKFKWGTPTSSFAWDLGMCTRSTLSKDGSKVMFRTEGCNNAEFNGKTAICTLKTPTEVECSGEFGVRTWSKRS